MEKPLHDRENFHVRQPAIDTSAGSPRTLVINGPLDESSYLILTNLSVLASAVGVALTRIEITNQRAFVIWASDQVGAQIFNPDLSLAGIRVPNFHNFVLYYTNTPATTADLLANYKHGGTKYVP